MTAQFPESLVYNGEEYGMASLPLEPYLEMHGIKFKALCTACWRGYKGSWEVADNRLYLTEFWSWLPDSDECVGMDYLFPGQERVFADWFSGEVRLPQGKLLAYVHLGFASVYEKDLFLKFVDGVLVDSWEVENEMPPKRQYPPLKQGKLFDEDSEDGDHVIVF